MPIDRKALSTTFVRASEERAKKAIDEGLTSPASAANLLGITTGLFACIAFLVDRFNEMEKEIAEAKQFPMKYLGPHEQGRAYNKNEFVSFSGSMWHAQRENAQRPGDGDAWVLAVKHGRDSR
jgi:hypothetical protein